AIGQKLRESMVHLTRRIELGDGNRLTTRSCNSGQRTRKVRRKQDRAIRAPGTAAARRSVGQELQRPARDVDAIELVGGKETDRAAVGGPERIIGTLRARQRAGTGFIQRPQPQPLRPIARCNKDDVAAIGRQGKLERGGRGWRLNIDAHLRPRESWAERYDESDRECQSKDHRCEPCQPLAPGRRDRYGGIFRGLLKLQQYSSRIGQPSAPIFLETTM